MSVFSKFTASLPYNCYEIAHPWTTSCNHAWSYLFLSCFREAGKVYAVLYLFAQLGIARKFRLVDFLQTFTSSLRSTTFLSYNVFFFMFLICMSRRLTGRFYLPQTCLYSGVLCSFMAIFIEAPHRRKALSMYMLNLFSEVLYNSLASNGLAPVVPYGDVMLFIAGMAGHIYLLNETNAKDPISRFLFFLVGRSEFSARPQAECPHEQSCAAYCLDGFLQPFAYGYLGRFSISLLASIPKLFSNPGHILTLAKNKANFSLAIFLGGITSTFRISRCLLRKTNVNDRISRTLAASLAASWFGVFRYRNLALYVFWKTIETYYLRGMARGVLPNIPLSREIIYSISTGFILFNAIMEPHHIRPSYVKFLNNITGSAVHHVNRHPASLGYNSTLLFHDYYPMDLDLTKVTREFFERVVIWS